MAWLALFVYLAGYPLATALFLRRRAIRLFVQTYRGFAPPEGFTAALPSLLLGFKAPMQASTDTGGSSAKAHAQLQSRVLPRPEQLIIIDAAATRLLMRRRPCAGCCVWLAFGRYRALLSLALSTESPAARSSRLADLRKLRSVSSAGSGLACRCRRGADAAIASPATSNVSFQRETAPAVPNATASSPETDSGAPYGADAIGVVPRWPLVAGGLVNAALDCTAAVPRDPWLSHWTGGTYRGSAYTARHTDFLLFAVLAAIQVFWAYPTTPDGVGARAAVNVTLLVAFAWYIATRSPFKEREPWKLWLKVGSLLLSALAAVLTHFALADSLRIVAGNTGAESSTARQGLSICVFAGCVLLLAALAALFAVSSISGAKEELLQLRVQRAAAADSAPAGISAVEHHKPTSSSSEQRTGSATALFNNPMVSHTKALSEHVRIPSGGGGDGGSLVAAASLRVASSARTARFSHGPLTFASPASRLSASYIAEEADKRAVAAPVLVTSRSKPRF